MRTVFFLIFLGFWISPVTAGEVKGTVRAGGLAIPGATVTAVEDGRQRITTTDAAGTFEFGDLPGGIWELRIEMLGFARATRQVEVGPGLTTADAELKLLAEKDLRTALHPDAAPEPMQPRPRNSQRADYQRLDVTQSANSSSFGSDTSLKSEEISDLSQSAANAFIVQGSLSTALGMPRMNDWGPPPDMGPGMDGGPGGMGVAPAVLGRAVPRADLRGLQARAVPKRR